MLTEALRAPGHTLLSILLGGLALFYIVEWIRTLPIISLWVARGKKPFACHVCMSGWASIAAHAALWYGLGERVPWAATGPGVASVCLILLYATDAMANTSPPEF